MKYILLPIHPEWCCKLMNGDKKTEVRRGTALYNAIDKLIKEQGKAPCLIYCTKGKQTLLAKNRYRPWFAITPYGSFEKNILNGKVVAMFEASAEEIYCEGLENGCGSYNYFFYTDELNDIREKSCLDEFELCDYLGKKRGGEVVGTAIHIHNLKVFDKPKELREMKLQNGQPVRCSPQSFMYIDID